MSVGSFNINSTALSLRDELVVKYWPISDIISYLISKNFVKVLQRKKNNISKLLISAHLRAFPQAVHLLYARSLWSVQ